MYREHARLRLASESNGLCLDAPEAFHGLQADALVTAAMRAAIACTPSRSEVCLVDPEVRADGLRCGCADSCNRRRGMAILARWASRGAGPECYLLCH